MDGVPDQFINETFTSIPEHSFIVEPNKYDVEGRLFHEHMRPGNVNEETEKDILSLSATNIIF